MQEEHKNKHALWVHLMKLLENHRRARGPTPREMLEGALETASLSLISSLKQTGSERKRNRKMVMAIRECAFWLQKGIKVLLIAVDVEGEHAGDLMNLVATAASLGIPSIAVSTRLGLGSPFSYGKKISCIGIINATEHEEELNTVLSLALQMI